MIKSYLDLPEQRVPLAAVSQRPFAVSEIIKYTSHKYSLLFFYPSVLTHLLTGLSVDTWHNKFYSINSIKSTVYWVQYIKPKNMLNIKRMICVDQMMNGRKLYLEGQNICKVCAVVLLPAPLRDTILLIFWHFKKKNNIYQ